MYKIPINQLDTISNVKVNLKIKLIFENDFIEDEFPDESIVIRMERYTQQDHSSSHESVQWVRSL